jgi:hypothetical protein
MAQERVPDDKKGKVTKPKPTSVPEKRYAPGIESKAAGLASLQRQVGNQAVQRLLAPRPGMGPVQRSGDAGFELDDETAERINRERGGGQPLDADMGEQVGGAMGQDFGGVQVHTSRESDELNQQLGSKAFTTGQDIFFREGAYEPGTSTGQELIAHELTHVAQQGAGRVHSGGRMAVNQPGDAFEHEADAAAKTATGPGAQAQVQRQEEEEEVQAQEEEEEVQAQEEEEEEVQAQEMEEEEEAPA